MNEKTDKHEEKQFNWLKEYQWQKGQSGNPKGRPKGKTLKEWCREFLMSMSEQARIDFVESIDPKEVWKMAEGLPQQDITSGGKPIPLLGGQSNDTNHNGNSKTTETKKEDTSD